MLKKLVFLLTIIFGSYNDYWIKIHNNAWKNEKKCLVYAVHFDIFLYYDIFQSIIYFYCVYP